MLADDTGLEVDALGGAPGVVSARYAGPGATDADNRAKLLRELAADGARGKARSARFRCVMVLAKRGAVLGTFDGAVEGVIINGERGEGGFGYDALFVPEGHCETFAAAPRRHEKRPQPPRPRARPRQPPFSRGHERSLSNPCCTCVSREHFPERLHLPRPRR